jgi:putative Ca2+/H+ antiporter (TMEM165/GDT1 family)
MHAFLIATGLVALAEIGDKTQLLALILAARFRRPAPIIGGIVLATAVNHALAGAVGAWLVARLGPDVLRWVLGVSFIAMAAWTLVPDKAEEGGGNSRWGVFLTTVVSFFLAEMGDKTQIATVALAARFHSFVAVVLGTTTGLLLADIPAVLLGDRLTHRLPMRALRAVAAAAFALLGALTLLHRT